MPIARSLRELTVASHVHGDSGLDGPALPAASRAPLDEDAVEFMARDDRSEPGPPVTLVPTGPLTNVALLLERTGGANVARIVLMGGSIAEGNMTPAAEFNIWADPEAAAGLPGRHRHDDDRPGRDTPGGDDSRAAGASPHHRSDRLFVADLVDFFTVFHRETYGWDGAPIHDAVAAAHVIRPGS